VTAGADGAPRDTPDLEPDGGQTAQPGVATDGAPAGDAPPAVGATIDGEGPGDDYRGEDAILDEMRGTIGELTGDLQRLQAEYLNYKRRVDRDREMVLQNAKVNVLHALLPVLDDIDRAREHEELTGGFRAVAEGLERVVGGAGLEKFGAPGDEFDPRLHEAMSHSYSDEVTTTTCQYVVQAGYQLGDRVVRPAKVMVVDPADGGASGGEPGGGADSEAGAAGQASDGETGTS
jgi:molecular chaperone GrpE